MRMNLLPSKETRCELRPQSAAVHVSLQLVDNITRGKRPRAPYCRVTKPPADSEKPWEFEERPGRGPRETAKNTFIVYLAR
jgi:hypothetical protein